MIVRKPDRRISRLTAAALKHLPVAIASCVAAGLGASACAATRPYNPDTLNSAQLAVVSNICQTVMGLNPAEPLSGGTWIGNDRLDQWTSHYRGCVISLSDTLQSVAGAEAARAADEGCRAQGLKPGSSEAALCALQTLQNDPPAASAPADAAVAIVGRLKTPARSFYSASPREVVQREQVACAALGLDPAHSAFDSCVKGLDRTFYAIDNPAE